MGRGGRLRCWRWWCASRRGADLSHWRPPPRSPFAPMDSRVDCLRHRPLPAPDPAPRHAPVILAKARTHGHRRAHRRKNAQSLCWPPPPQQQQRRQRQTLPQSFGPSLPGEKACTVWPKPANWRAPAGRAFVAPWCAPGKRCAYWQNPLCRARCEGMALSFVRLHQTTLHASLPRRNHRDG